MARTIVPLLLLGMVAARGSGSPVADPHAAARLPAPEEPRYLLLWRPPEAVAGMVRRIGATGDGTTRLLGFGLPCSTFAAEKQVPDMVRSAFAAARRNNVAVMLQFDFHVEWRNRPDLWNWFDPAKPGYNPNNRANVEWFGWNGPVAQVRYLNWGAPERMAPPVCFTSKRVRAEWRRLIGKVIVPAILPELAQLRREGKGRLFAGILVGSEPTVDNYRKTDPDTARMIDADRAPRGQLGYRALLDRGYSASKPPPDMVKALAGIVQETVAFWCRAFVEAGISPSKLYPHIPAGADDAVTCTPAWTAFNQWSRPGWSTYGVGPLREGFGPLYTELRKHGGPAWGGVEANVGFPGTLADWETYLAWHYNHGAVLVGINTGATGTELPGLLEKSAFSPDAIAAYRKFLSGAKLVAKPLPGVDATKRIRAKMATLQAGFQSWLKDRRDPSPIARDVERVLPALLQAGKLPEAEAVIDAAIRKVADKGGAKP